jgi:hypothetical protein
VSEVKIVFVLGMGRSGTSALTRVLSLCGGALPDSLLGANERNPKGHWEPIDALKLNDEFLFRHGSTWFDPSLRLQGEVSFDTRDDDTYMERIEAFLAACPKAPILVIKEPRITALSDYWFTAARRHGFSVGAVVAIRHPEEVAASLAAYDRASLELGNALWLKYNLLAERQSRSMPRVFVEYSNLLRDWRTEIARVEKALSIELAERDDAAIGDFLTQDLHRHLNSGRVAKAFGQRWSSQVYKALSAAAQDAPLNLDVLDDVFQSYRVCEREFRISLDDFRAHFGPPPASPRTNDAVAVDPDGQLPGASGSIDEQPAAEFYEKVDLPDELPNSKVTKLLRSVAKANSRKLQSCLRGEWYLQQHPDIVSAKVDPYEHWLSFGAEEGRLPTDDPLILLGELLQEREQLAQQEMRQELQGEIEASQKVLLEQRSALQNEIARVKLEAGERAELQLRELTERAQTLASQLLQQQSAFGDQQVQLADATAQRIEALGAQGAEREHLLRKDVQSLQERLWQTQTHAQEILEQTAAQLLAQQEKFDSARAVLSDAMEQRLASQAEEHAVRERQLQDSVQDLQKRLEQLQSHLLATQAEAVDQKLAALAAQQTNSNAQRTTWEAEFRHRDLQLRQELQSLQERLERTLAEERALLQMQYSSVLMDIKKDLEKLQGSMSWRWSAPIRAIAAAFGSEGRLPEVPVIEPLMRITERREREASPNERPTSSMSDHGSGNA